MWMFDTVSQSSTIQVGMEQYMLLQPNTSIKMSRYHIIHFCFMLFYPTIRGNVINIFLNILKLMYNQDLNPWFGSVKNISLTNFTNLPDEFT